MLDEKRKMQIILGILIHLQKWQTIQIVHEGQ